MPPKDSLRVIAPSLGRAASTVSREIARNAGRRQYRAAASDERAWSQALRPKLCKLATHRPLRRVVARLLERNWSPQQITQLFALCPVLSKGAAGETLNRGWLMFASLSPGGIGVDLAERARVIPGHQTTWSRKTKPCYRWPSVPGN